MVGGGFLLTPFLKILFGIPYPLAVGCSRVLIFVNATVAVAGNWKKKNVDTLLGAILAIGALIGTEIGIKLLRFLNSKGAVTFWGSMVSMLDLVLNCTFIILMLVVCISIFTFFLIAENSVLILIPDIREIGCLHTFRVMHFV